MKDEVHLGRNLGEVGHRASIPLVPIQTSPGFVREQPANCSECPVRAIGLFSGLAPSDIDDTLSGISNGLLRASSILYQAGEPADAVFTIRYGVVQMVDPSPPGDTRVIRLLGRGSAVGLESLDAVAYEHTATAMRDVSVCRIPTRILRDLQGRSPRLTQGLIRKWHEHARRADQMIGTLSNGSLRARVRSLLGLIADVAGDPPEALRLPRRIEMAKMLGVSMESVSRCMAELVRHGLMQRVAPWTYWCDPSLIGRGTTPRIRGLDVADRVC
jgi:CRP-like cAMP-binding protein